MPAPPRAPLDRLARWLQRFEGAPAALARYALKLSPARVPAVARSLAWHVRGGRYLFLLAHWRSGSTLLSHILQTNPEIAGVGETHRRYRTSADLLALAVQVIEERRLARAPTWVLEKALHPMQARSSLLTSERVRVILLCREPGATLRSQLDDLPGVFGGPTASPARKESLAATRLAHAYDALAAHAEALGPRAFALDYDALLATPTPVLAALTRWLGLHAPLTPEYRVDAFTAALGRGDPTPAIRRGRIDPMIPRGDRPLDPTWLAMVERHYRSLRETITHAGLVTAG